LIASTLLPLVGVAAASPVAASSCQALVAKRAGEPPTSSVLVTVPTALLGQELQPSNFTVSQRVEPVAVHSAQRLAASRVDLAIVLDTPAAAPEPAVARARRFAAALLGNLPPDVRVAVVSGGRNPTVMSALGDPRARALLAVRQSGRTAGHGGLDGVALAGVLLGADSYRSRHVVLISTGNDDSSRSDVAAVLTRLVARGISLHPVSVRGSTGPSWGGLCPPPVRAGQEAAAGSLLASRVAETYELVVPLADMAAPISVRVRRGPVDASAQLAVLSPAGTAVRGTKIEGQAPAGSRRGLNLWILAGLLTVATALLVDHFRRWPSGPGPLARSSWFTDTHPIVLPPGPPSRTPPPPVPPDHGRE
jgi:hypothetical protein